MTAQAKTDGGHTLASGARVVDLNLNALKTFDRNLPEAIEASVQS